MTEQLVADVRLRRVHGLGAVAYVLGGVEYPEGETGKEVPGGEQA